MQALTVAIGPKGITFFAQNLVSGELINCLSTLKPPDRNLTVPDITHYTAGYNFTISNIQISLTNGSLSGYSPTFSSVSQQAGGQFPLVMVGSNFSANYKWYESYHDHSCSTSSHGSYCNDYDGSNTFTYSPSVGSLTTTVTLGFVYNNKTQSYEIDVVNSTGQTANMTANIPGNSVLQNEDASCFSSHVSDTTEQLFDNIDFSSALQSVLPSMLQSIPASGKLTDKINYEFGLGDSGLTFPNNNGIAIGVTGKVSYNGQYYPGTVPAALPVPPVPTDSHHLQMYVSDYEINALHWAYYQAGLLNTTVNPSDLPDPDVLKVKTYVNLVPAFKPYQTYAMQAQVNPKAPPVVAFQDVYIFTSAAMSLLQTQLPNNIYQEITGLEGNAYVAKADLEADLSEVDQSWWPAIEKATIAMGMAVTQNLEFTMTIQTPNDPKPNLVFDVQRTDILQNLALGIAGKAQTMQYAFQQVKYATTFVSTTVPNFDKTNFADLVWPVAGEPRYDQTLTAMGQTGVPLPIMADFQFLFDQAVLSIQEGYVSILSDVKFKS